MADNPVQAPPERVAFRIRCASAAALASSCTAWATLSCSRLVGALSRFADRRIYQNSVAHTRIWEDRQAVRAASQLATDLDRARSAPTSTDDAMLESERLGLAANAFRAAIDRALRKRRRTSGDPPRRPVTSSRIRETSEKIHTETEALVSQYSMGKIPESRDHVLALRRARSEVRERLEELDRRAREIQSTNLSEQEAAVTALMRIGLVVAVVVAMLVVCVCLYGRRMWHQVRRRATSNVRGGAARQRAAHVADPRLRARRLRAMDAKGRILE
jgi:hypothetical protein